MPVLVRDYDVEILRWKTNRVVVISATKRPHTWLGYFCNDDCTIAEITIDITTLRRVATSSTFVHARVLNENMVVAYHYHFIHRRDVDQLRRELIHPPRGRDGAPSVSMGASSLGSFSGGVTEKGPVGSEDDEGRSHQGTSLRSEDGAEVVTRGVSL